MSPGDLSIIAKTFFLFLFLNRLWLNRLSTRRPLLKPPGLCTVHTCSAFRTFHFFFLSKTLMFRPSNPPNNQNKPAEREREREREDGGPFVSSQSVSSRGKRRTYFLQSSMHYICPHIVTKTSGKEKPMKDRLWMNTLKPERPPELKRFSMVFCRSVAGPTPRLTGLGPAKACCL